MDDEFEIPAEARMRYIERRQSDIESLRTALQSQNWAEFKRIGHQIKGNAASFGYLELEKVAIQLELAGERHDLIEASRQLTFFENWYAQVTG